MGENVGLRDSTRLVIARAIELRSGGMSVTDIAKKLDCSTNTVTRYLRSHDSRAIIERAHERIEQLITKSIDVVLFALDNPDKDLGNSLKAAVHILKTHGLIKETTDINHNFPKPTVIKRRDGSEVVLSASKEIEHEIK
jgi:AcrR family transcriptional regulator